VLTGHPAVEQAFVVGVPDERMGEVAWAWVVPSGGRETNQAELIRYCRQHLAPFKVPRRVVAVAADELPKTTTGKVQKYRLAASVAGVPVPK
jgi:fatty-acyl-CoA synthase